MRHVCMAWTMLSETVCLSITCRYPFDTAERILKIFSLSGSPTILVFPHQTGWQYSDGDPLTGASNAKGMKKSRFSTNIVLYLWNDARYSHSYYGMWIGNCIQAFEWYQFERPWVTSNPDFKVTIIQHKITRKWYNTALYLRWPTNRKLYMIYQMVPFSMTLNNP